MADFQWHGETLLESGRGCRCWPGQLLRATMPGLLMSLLVACSADGPAAGIRDAAMQKKLDALELELKTLRSDYVELRQHLASAQVTGVVEEIPLEQLFDPEGELLTEPDEASDGDEDIVFSSDDRRQMRQQRRVEQAGLTQEEFSSMERVAAQLRQEQLEDDYQRRRERYLNSDRNAWHSSNLRGQLGDDGYDRYLFATGRPNRVSVNEVLPDSAAEQAGLRAGDTIVSYSGERVFSFGEVRELSYQGEMGETVLMEVRRRDGSMYQASMPRGPMGISSGRGQREAPQ